MLNFRKQPGCVMGRCHHGYSCSALIGQRRGWDESLSRVIDWWISCWVFNTFISFYLWGVQTWTLWTETVFTVLLGQEDPAERILGDWDFTGQLVGDSASAGFPLLDSKGSNQSARRERRDHLHRQKLTVTEVRHIRKVHLGTLVGQLRAVSSSETASDLLRLLFITAV